ncbi:MAG: thioredoxin domain-containing protein [Gammaproteobacteria bacterium]|nr:thioredoxin domain-containing protein [Gammaproteobacteria bacterium]
MAGSDTLGDSKTQQGERGQRATARNRLATSSSPYLRQHADNPVAWQPWDEESLEAAREQRKPILLSIGYSACHWCHVMARESFEDEQTAVLMNELFINIKVDREERPDLDRIYQQTHQLLTQRSGGWPLTVVLSPDDLTPFFAGTYFPREARFGMPGFADVLKRVHAAWQDQPDAINQQNDKLRQVLMKFDTLPVDASEPLTYKPLTEARRQIETQFDSENGGIGSAPKFPNPTLLELLTRHAFVENDLPAQRLAMFSLRRMGERGLYDHLGGGFFRYCVDARWEIPHFEKMLYDNAQLLSLYAKAWQRTGQDDFHRIANETADWAMREMRSPEGTFYSSLDADSEQENGERAEGAFYTWTREQLAEAMLGHEHAGLLESIASQHFGLDRQPNFDRLWHLNITADIDDLSREQDAEREDIEYLVSTARQRMFEKRAERPHPARDDKILTSWNALMIRALANAGSILEREELLDAAGDALNHLRTSAWKDNRLHAVISGTQALYPAYLDDHAFLLDAILTLLECRWDSAQVHFARDLAENLLEDFEDLAKGGFFFTASYHDNPVRRLKTYVDDAMPSGNGIAARSLYRLGRLLGEPRYIQAADRCLRAAWPDLLQSPRSHATLLLALREALDEPPTIILRGDPTMMSVWRERLMKALPPHALIFQIPTDADDLPEELSVHKPQGVCTAYVCRGFSCSPPITDRDALHAFIQERYSP